MNLRTFLPMLLLCSAPVAPAAEQAVPFSAVAEAVRAQLQSRSSGLPGTLELKVLGRDDSLRLPAGRHEIQVGAVAGAWPRARVAVPVRHLVDARPVRSQTVWVAVRWWNQAEVYADAFPAGTPVAALKHRQERVDLAPFGPAFADASPPAGQRLRRPVRAGQPLSAADFEPMPDVLAGTELQVEVVRGAVRLSTSGRALAEGSVGDHIPVALDARRQPVISTILSPQAVRVED
jgi:flagella basal body P-ring formation protein FlgA